MPDQCLEENPFLVEPRWGDYPVIEETLFSSSAYQFLLQKCIIHILAGHTVTQPYTGRLRSAMAPKNVEFPEMDWFLANFDRIIQIYPNQWIAIKYSRIVANAANLKDLRAQVKAQNVISPFITKADVQAWCD